MLTKNFLIQKKIFFNGEKENILERKKWCFISDLLKKILYVKFRIFITIIWPLIYLLFQFYFIINFFKFHSFLMAIYGLIRKNFIQ